MSEGKLPFFSDSDEESVPVNSAASVISIGSSISLEAYSVSSTSTDATERIIPSKFRSRSQTPTLTRPAKRQSTPRVKCRMLRNIQDPSLADFNPETSNRTKRKLLRNVQYPPGALYDEKGVHIESGVDLCDCLNRECGGCFFECPKCKSRKCGKKCRVYRKFVYDMVKYDGYGGVVRNPLL